MAINKYKSHKLIKELMMEMKASQVDNDYTGEEFWGDGDDDEDDDRVFDYRGWGTLPLQR